VDKAHDAGLPRTGGDAPRRLDMDGSKSPVTALDIEADGIHHGVGIGERALDGAGIIDIGAHERRAGREFRYVARRHPDGKAMIEQVADDSAAQEAGPAEHHNDPIRHGLYSNFGVLPPA
jgi:hypothetical protein